MRVEKIVIYTSGAVALSVRGGMAQGTFNNLMGMIAVESTCPEIYTLSKRPTCGNISAHGQGIYGSIKPGAFGSDPVKRIESHQVRLMTVAVLAYSIVALTPLAQDFRTRSHTIERFTPCAGIKLCIQSGVKITEF